MLGTRATSSTRGPSPHGRRDLVELVVVVSLLVATIALSIVSGKSIYIFGYIMAIVSAIRGPMRKHRPWRDLGLKSGFVKDLKHVWYYVAAVALLFQVLPPTFGVAYLFGHYSDLRQHILGRLSINFGSMEGLATVGGLLAAMLVLTLIEELVFRVTIQERLGWFLGTPVAILVASAIFASAHLAGTSGSLPVILLDVTGVALDGIFLGIIYARTHNLALTWATHFAADAVGLLALLLIL
jgi:membrane protease YdiL (CAAX protease family)